MLFETKRSLQKNYFYTQTERDIDFVGHVHMSYEFVTVTEGRLECSVYDRTYTLTPGKAMLILPNHVHRYESPEHNRSFICIFSPDYIQEFHDGIKFDSYTYSVFDWTDEGRIAALTDEKTDKFIRKAVLYQICSRAASGLVRMGEKNGGGGNHLGIS